VHTTYKVKVQVLKLQVIQGFIKCHRHIFWGMMTTPEKKSWSLQVISYEVLKETKLQRDRQRSGLTIA
jgi:hypothetical protein